MLMLEEFKKRLDNIDTYVYIMELLGYSKNESLDSYRKVLKKSYDE